MESKKKPFLPSLRNRDVFHKKTGTILVPIVRPYGAHDRDLGPFFMHIQAIIHFPPQRHGAGVGYRSLCRLPAIRKGSTVKWCVT